MAKGVLTFVGGKTGDVGGDFKQHASIFAEVERLKILPVDLPGDGVACGGEFFTQCHLYVVIRYAEGYMVHGAASYDAAPLMRQHYQVDAIAGGAPTSLKAVAVAAALGGAEIEDIRQQAAGSLGIVHGQRHALEAADGFVGWNPTAEVGLPEVCIIRYQLQLQAVRVEEDEIVFTQAVRGFVVDGVACFETRHPVVEAPRRHAKAGLGDLSRPALPASDVLPREEGEDGARVALLVSEIEVVSARVVEIHGLFHQAQAQYAGVEVEIALRIARDGCDVVDAVDGVFHG